ncbi:MAG: hypothetical protein Q9209_001558 [Squamulea sp. 1 TL-2023]
METPTTTGTPSDVLIVAHGHILRAFAMRWIKPGGVGTLSYEHHNIDEPAILLYKIDPNIDLTLSIFNFPQRARVYRRGLATGDDHVVWCCENSTTYITIAVPIQVWSDPGLDALNTLSWAIKDVEAKTFRYGLQRLGGGYWAFALDQVNDISALDVGPSQNGLTIKHLNWPVLRDGLKALKDFIADQNLTQSVRGLQFGIHSAHLGQVGKGQFA